MTLQTLNLWEIIVDGAQIFLCGLILLVLIRNQVKYKQLLLKAPAVQRPQNFNAEFMIQTIRQQSDLAFSHILETIDKERQTLETCFELKEPQRVPHILPPSPDSAAAEAFDPQPAEPNAEHIIYSDIETLAGQGRSTEDISEQLNIPKGEVELVLKLKRLRAESAKNKNAPPR